MFYDLWPFTREYPPRAQPIQNSQLLVSKLCGTNGPLPKEMNKVTYGESLGDDITFWKEVYVTADDGYCLVTEIRRPLEPNKVLFTDDRREYKGTWDTFAFGKVPEKAIFI